MMPRRDPDSTYPGYTIRLPIKGVGLLQSLSDPYRMLTLNRLLAGMVIDIVAICLSYPVQINPKGLLLATMHSRADLTIWEELAKNENDFRNSVPYAQSKAVKVTFPREERAKIAQISRRLRWSEGQVVVEAIQAFIQLASAKPKLIVLPDIIRVCRGEFMISEGGSNGENSEPAIVGQINRQCGLEAKPKVDQPDPEGEGFSTDLNLI